MNHRIGTKFTDKRCEEFVIGNIAHERFDFLAAYFLPRAKPFRKGADRRERLYSKLVVTVAADKVFDNRYGMSHLRKVESCCPATVSISAQNGNLHVSSLRQ